ncbi:MAG: calcium/sodium antiporter [Bacilli bacterium]|jgi:cation:H+ antiporter|nr:calcium/sodium antiporter [Bacilli bacterium]
MEIQALLNITYGWEGLNSPWRMVVVIVYLIVGLVLLVYGGDWFVDGSVWFAEKFKIPKLIIGATVVSMCTTMPEFLVSTFASIEGASFLRAGEDALAVSSVDMATGNAIGSVICNTGLILALSMLFRPMNVERKTFLVKPLMLIFSIGMFWILVIDRQFQFWDGIIMLLILVAFLVDNIIEAKQQMAKESSLGREIKETKMPVIPSQTASKEDKSQEKVNENQEKNEKKNSTAYYVFLFFIGVLAIIVGAQLLVDNGTEFATELGVSNKIIAVTIVAIGTSLPELITAIISIIKKQSDLSVGNIIGANIIDQCLILSVASFIFPSALPVYNSTMYLDLPFGLTIALAAIVPTLVSGKLKRWQGFTCLGLYISYLVLYFIYF